MTRANWNTHWLLAMCLLTSIACEEGRDSEELAQLLSNGSDLEYDVAESGLRFVFDEAPVFEDGMPAYGNPFITQGFVYPAGFLDEKPGVDSDGVPAHPEAVVGEWTCRGTMIGDGVKTEAGPMVITTQHWDFYDEPGYEPAKQSGFANLVTEGYESADLDVTWQRPITGGTGRFTGARGESSQRFLGINASEGFNLRVGFDILRRSEPKPVANEHHRR